MSNIGIKLATLGLLGTMVLAPTHANADFFGHRHRDHDLWQTAAIGSAALGLVGLANHNGPVTALGAVGALYSIIRLQNDCGHDAWCDGYGPQVVLGGNHFAGGRYVPRATGRREIRRAHH